MSVMAALDFFLPSFLALVFNLIKFYDSYNFYFTNLYSGVILCIITSIKASYESDQEYTV